MVTEPVKALDKRQEKPLVAMAEILECLFWKVLGMKDDPHGTAEIAFPPDDYDKYATPKKQDEVEVNEAAAKTEGYTQSKIKRLVKVSGCN